MELVIKSFVSLAACALLAASSPTCVATTAKPFPISPALAASIDAFRESIFVCCAIELISPIIFSIAIDISLIFCIDSLSSSIRDCVCNIFSDVFSVVRVTFSVALTLLFNSCVSCVMVCFKSSTAFSCSPVPL